MFLRPSADMAWTHWSGNLGRVLSENIQNVDTLWTQVSKLCSHLKGIIFRL